MGIQPFNHKKPPSGDKSGKKSKAPTRRTVELLKDAYCQQLKGLYGELSNSEVTYEGALKLYNKKKCSFTKTEKNYRAMRNLSLSSGVELTQASAEIKKNVEAYIKYNGDDKNGLVGALKDVLKKAKDAKVKFGELHDAAFKLDTARKDRCNASQMIILGCWDGEDCGGEEKKQQQQQQEGCGEKPQGCDDICQVLDELVSIPDSLRNDSDILFNAAAEIVGIQTFTNIKTLEKFQKDFADNAKAFTDLLDITIKSGADGVTNAQKALTEAIQSLTTSTFILYGKRNDTETVDSIKDYLCCHECKCLGDCGCEGHDHSGDEGLKECKCDICDICKEVKDVYAKKENAEASQV